MINELIGLVKRHIPSELRWGSKDVEEYVTWHVLRKRIVLCLDHGIPVGAGFISRIKDPRKFDQFAEEEEGSFIYCSMVIGAADMLGRLIGAAALRFPGTKYLCFQRQHRGDDKMRIWRLR